MITFEQVSPAKRSLFHELLLLGDEDAKILAGYEQQGTLLAGYKKAQPIVVALVCPQDAQTLELKNLAVIPAFWRQGIGTLAIQAVIKFAKENHYQSVLVGTGDASLGNIHFYLKNGFRFDSIKPNFFQQYGQPIYEEGVLLKDMVMLRQYI